MTNQTYQTTGGEAVCQANNHTDTNRTNNANNSPLSLRSTNS